MKTAKHTVWKYATVREINAHYRANDDSHKWPISGKFNATERAIRRLRKTGQYTNGGQAYYDALAIELSRIVNGSI